ncbi:MAG: hypothetical protein IAC32_07190 [Bacteroidetes bacterium]|uniref:Uncharacterized protein n=1 Tax=Candidatus Enterocola intestinipullorum TaxID=2840783 RepID=A0A9D9HE31_9BACT|nr:hypothetical protein [Candidatus Enterocola intestinipullorum]
MGKQKNDEAANKLVGIMVAVFLIFLFASVIAPIAALVLFLVNWIRYLAQDRKWRPTNFWLTEQEQEQYENAAYVLSQADEERRRVRDSAVRQGIYRNQDGQISRRSYAGKELRERENTANSLINDCTPIYQELESRPQNRWKKARSHYSNAFGFGLVVFILLAAGLVWYNNNYQHLSEGKPIQSEVVDSTEVEKPQMEGQAENAEDQTDSSSEKDIFEIWGTSIGYMAGFLGALALIWLIGWLIGRIRFALKNPEPPLVSAYNVNTYAEEFMEKKARKEAERQQRKERREQKREQKRTAEKLAKEEKIRINEQKLEAENSKAEPDTASNVVAAETETVAPIAIANNPHQRSKEENLFISWADSLRNEGYNITGNWENWENAGLWKNLAVVSSMNGVDIRIIVEYYVKSKKIYFGIAKLNDEDKVSQELLNSETFQNVITENGLTVKNNEWWYCLKFSTFDKVFQEYRHLIDKFN